MLQQDICKYSLELAKSAVTSRSTTQAEVYGSAASLLRAGSRYSARSCSSAVIVLSMRSVSATGPAIVRHVRLSVSPPTMDQPRQGVPGHSCHEQPEQRVLCQALGYSLPTLTNIPLGLWVAFACLTDIAPALVVCVWHGPGGAIRPVLQRPDLIQKVLGWVLLRLVQMIIRREPVTCAIRSAPGQKPRS
jgi:hypothetical protein